MKIEELPASVRHGDHVHVHDPQAAAALAVGVLGPPLPTISCSGEGGLQVQCWNLKKYLSQR